MPDYLVDAMRMHAIAPKLPITNVKVFHYDPLTLVVTSKDGTVARWTHKGDRSAADRALKELADRIDNLVRD